MPRRVEQFEIDGESYQLTQLGALEGRRLLVRFAKGLAPMLEQLKLDLSGAKGKGGGLVASLLEAEVAKTILPAIGTFIEQLDEQLFVEMCDKFGQHCCVHIVDQHGDRWPPLRDQVFDDHFAGRYGLMLRWFIKCLAINGGDFLTGWARMSPPAGAAGTPSK